MAEEELAASTSAHTCCGNIHGQRTPRQSIGFLFAPSSRYPEPAAFVINHGGRVLHSWSHSVGQPAPEDDPPNYLRGWNHVHVADDGSLHAIVPLRALIKLTARSQLVWCCDLAAHHDLDIDTSGLIRVLSEVPRRVAVDGRSYTILDNQVASVDAQGVLRGEVSIYDVVRTEPQLRRMIDHAVERRAADFAREPWPAADSAVTPASAAETRHILNTAAIVGDQRRTLQRLRDLPGSPCDVMHTNTLELVDGKHARWRGRADALICMRELNTVAAVNFALQRVVWSWGPGYLSGPHQPSLLPDGNVLIFDNGTDSRRSRLVIVDPSTQEIVWSWCADPPQSFYCPLAGGCEQLPNGNFLVTNSSVGGAFELTKLGTIIWRIELPVEIYGAGRGRVSLYRMAAVAPRIVRGFRRSEMPLPTSHVPTSTALTGRFGGAP